jgi:hypothetical protein
MAIPSFVALCFLAAAHTLQTMNLRLAQTAPIPIEALLQEYLPDAPAIRTAHAVATRLRAYECLLNNRTARSRRLAFLRESNTPRFMLLPVAASSLHEYRFTGSDFSFRNMGNLDAKHKPFSARAIFPRRRMRLSALTRRPRSLSPALAAYS